MTTITPCPATPRMCEPARAMALVVSELTLAFFVSSDEEYVRLTLVEPVARDLGERTFHYLLLTLARQRLADASRGVPPPACGWIAVDDFARDPMMTPARVSLGVFRARRQLAAAGVLDAERIVERRRGTRQIRLGSARAFITRV
jgi:hypothetical protein